MWKFKKSWFTLIEMLIVIIIIAIILSFTMKFSGNRINLLNDKNVQEEFIAQYDKLYLTAMNTNYISWQIYDKLDIILKNWWTWIQYQYKLWDNVVESWFSDLLNWKIEINVSQGDATVKKAPLTITFTPYELWCSFSGNNTNSTTHAKEKDSRNFSIKINNTSREYCFSINKNVWRLMKAKCD